MRALATLVVAAGLGLVTSVASASEATGFRGVSINDTETDVRAALAESDCRPTRTPLSRYACRINALAWGSPVLAVFMFYGEQERRLVIISLSFEPEDRASIERGLVSEYGQADSVKEGDPYWTRPDAAIWIQRERDRVMFARRDHIERANTPIKFPCPKEGPAHLNAWLNCVPEGDEPSRR
jgi:hypothetical protein